MYLTLFFISIVDFNKGNRVRTKDNLVFKKGLKEHRDNLNYLYA